MLISSGFSLQDVLQTGLPLVGSDVARHWDMLYHFLTWLSIVFFIIVVGAMIYFAVVYRKGRAGNTKYITHNHALEAFWTVIPTILLLVIFTWGWFLYKDMVTAPSSAMEVKVIGKQWNWTFQYPDGRVSQDLYAPIGQPVKMLMTSEDVLHSFFIPNFRIKQDVVPGMYTSVWFEATVPGKHQIYCAEYCGGTHSQMLAQVVVLSHEQWAAWQRGKDIGNIGRAGGEVSIAKVESKAVASLVDQGKALMQSKGCIACHSDDGTNKIGPSHKGVYGSKIEMADGSVVEADENYIRESIEKPNAKIVKGYNPVMPTYQGQFSALELNAVVEYIKSLR